MIGIKERVIEFVVSWSQKSKYFWKSRNHITKIFGNYGITIANILVAFGFLEKKGNRRGWKYRPVRPIRSDKYNDLVSLVGDIVTMGREIGISEARKICSQHNVAEFFEPQIRLKDPKIENYIESLDFDQKDSEVNQIIQKFWVNQQLPLGKSLEEFTEEIMKMSAKYMNLMEMPMNQGEGNLTKYRIRLGMLFHIQKKLVKRTGRKWKEWFAENYDERHLRSVQDYMALAKVPNIINYAVFGKERLTEIQRTFKPEDFKKEDPIGDFLQTYRIDMTGEQCFSRIDSILTELRKEKYSNDLSHYGLLVTQDVTKNYKPVWEVSGETKPVAEILKMCGGIWYPPKQVWSFYRGDPSENLKKVLDDANKRGYVKSLKVASAPTEVPTSEVIKRRVNPSKVTSDVIEPIPTEGSSLEKSKDFVEELQKAFLSGETLEKVLRLPDNVKVDVTVRFVN